jgi:hypothetical protein
MELDSLEGMGDILEGTGITATMFIMGIIMGGTESNIVDYYS